LVIFAPGLQVAAGWKTVKTAGPDAAGCVGVWDVPPGIRAAAGSPRIRRSVHYPGGPLRFRPMQTILADAEC